MAVSARLFAFALLLPAAGCDLLKPVLTQEAFFAAARRCGAQQPRFIAGSGLPTIAFTEAKRPPSGQAPAAASCLAETLKGYRLKAMTIEFDPPIAVSSTTR